MAGWFDGMGDWLGDPSGMGGYRSGLKQQEAAQRKELEAMRGRMGTLGEEALATGQQISGAYAPIAGLAGVGAGQMQGDFTTPYEKYNFTGKVEDYLDPSIAYQQQQASKQIQSGAAAQGNLLSGAAQKALSDRAQQIGQQGYQQAFQNMQNERQYGSSQAQQDYLNRLNANQLRYGQAKDIAGLGMQGLQGQTQGMQWGQNARLGLLGPAYGQMVDPTAGLGDIRAAEMRGSATSGLSSLAGDFIGSLFS